MNPKILALYLPQFHPFPENDLWWGKGFTEWTNVGKAKPLFKGHDQPRVPSELGYYDLRLPLIREQQAEMAKDAGVTAFLYWHYWLGGGRRLLPEVFHEVLTTGKPDFQFALAWANHTWRAVGLTADFKSNSILAEQTYPGIEDAQAHFKLLLTAFQDPRYVKVDGKPFLYIFDPVNLPIEYIQCFKHMSVEAGLRGIYLVANTNNQIKKEDMIAKGFDAVCNGEILGHGGFDTSSFRHRVKKHLEGIFFHRPAHAYNYKELSPYLYSEDDRAEDVIPQILPQWDHSPRGGRKTLIFTGTTPDLFERNVRQAMELIKNKNDEHQILILKSWNEWAEGNYMEPDLTNGRGYIEALRKVVDEYRFK